MRNHFLVLMTLIICLTAVSACGAESADTAENITSYAQIALSRKDAGAEVLTDGDYRTQWAAENGYLEFMLPADRPCYTLYALISSHPENVIVQEEKNGRWEKVAVEGEPFNSRSFHLQGLTHFRLAVTKGQLKVMEVRLFGQGTLPPDVVDFQETADKADLMILACHPDDDILWLGGLMPTYAGQLGMKVQVAYMTSRFHYRRCEAMDALWHCGVRQGPVFAEMPDNGKSSYVKAVKEWGGIRATSVKIARMIRRFRPEVLVTQDTNGEYGHNQHRLMVVACNQAVQMAADPKQRDLRGLPAWEVKKYYIHLYPEDALVLDFECPLPAFGGKTAFDVAKEAFLLHSSQQNGRYEVAIDGPYDIRRYGLAYSAVGPDEAHDGLFEHIDGLYEIERSLSRNKDGEV